MAEFMMELDVGSQCCCLQAYGPSNKFDRYQETLQWILIWHENLRSFGIVHKDANNEARILASLVCSVTKWIERKQEFSLLECIQYHNHVKGLDHFKNFLILFLFKSLQVTLMPLNETLIKTRKFLLNNDDTRNYLSLYPIS
ncbi:hypothetical protein ACKWTF_000313 [Chironomus riparius]